MTEHIDLSAVEAFIRISELRSFTHAAEALGTTQACISLKLKRLEAQLGYSLLERTPRNVRLSPSGEVFISIARDLLGMQRRALLSLNMKSKRLAIGISEYVAGPEVPTILAKTMESNPAISLEARIGSSSDLLSIFDKGDVDAVVVRNELSRRDGEELFIDEYDWYGKTRAAPGDPLRFVGLAASCGIRSIATRMLARAGISWVNAFTCGSLGEVITALQCGIGVAPLPCRLAPSSLKPVGSSVGLPPLPPSRVVLHTLSQDKEIKRALKTLVSSLRDTGEMRENAPVLKLAASPPH